MLHFGMEFIGRPVSVSGIILHAKKVQNFTILNFRDDTVLS